MSDTEDSQVKKVSLFDMLSSVMETKNYLYNDDTEKEYVPFMINRGVSQHPDTILFANEMNKCPSLTKKMQYDFFFYSLSRKQRRGKWAKAEDSDKADLDLISKHYSVSREKAVDYLKLIDQDDLAALRNNYNIGGR